jgi:hypothetical protein
MGTDLTQLIALGAPTEAQLSAAKAANERLRVAASIAVAPAMSRGESDKLDYVSVGHVAGTVKYVATQTSGSLRDEFVAFFNTIEVTEADVEKARLHNQVESRRSGEERGSLVVLTRQRDGSGYVQARGEHALGLAECAAFGRVLMEGYGVGFETLHNYVGSKRGNKAPATILSRLFGAQSDEMFPSLAETRSAAKEAVAEEPVETRETPSERRQRIQAKAAETRQALIAATARAEAAEAALAAAKASTSEALAAPVALITALRQTGAIVAVEPGKVVAALSLAGLPAEAWPAVMTALFPAPAE